MKGELHYVEVATPSDAGKEAVHSLCVAMHAQLEAQQFSEFMAGVLAACSAHLALAIGPEPAARMIHSVAESTLEAAEIVANRRKAH